MAGTVPDRRAVRRTWDAIVSTVGVSTALAAVTFAICLFFTFGPGDGRMSADGAVAVSAVAAAAVWLSGRHPVAALVVVGVATLAQPVMGISFEAMDIVVVFVVFQAAMNTALPPWLLLLVSLTILTINDAYQRFISSDDWMQPSVLYPALLTALAVGLGLQSRRALRQHAELARLRDADRRQALSDERRRIARDIHDVAAHHLSALIVHNQLAIRRDTAGSLQEAAEFTARTAAAALDSLRSVVQVLQIEPEAPRAPAPGLMDLPEIFALVESSGLVVHRRITDLGDVNRELELTIVRIIQESLANILRHRGPGECWVELERSTAGIVLTIDDDGPFTVADHHPAHPSGPAPIRSGGHGAAGLGGSGLIGMRERASASRGELSVGVSPRGGFRVRAVFDRDGNG